MTETTIFITGANGIIGRGLVNYFLSTGQTERVIALGLPESGTLPAGVRFIPGDILDAALLDEVADRFAPTLIFHLAGLLSTSGERNPQRAHRINVDGSFNVIEMARKVTEKRGEPVTFVFASTMAAYGVDASRRSKGSVREDECLNPITMYGTNKLYVERLGNYYSKRYRMLEEDGAIPRMDFCAIRLPGVLSTDDIPSGGTTDYATEMLHAAARGEAYSCFVREDLTLPFMTLPDAVRALLLIAGADRKAIREPAYNVTSFSVSAKQFEEEIRRHFPELSVRYEPHMKRELIALSWPTGLDDSAAQRDFGWKPEHSFSEAFSDYLIPGLRRHYGI